jgi:hypothetical protein
MNIRLEPKRAGGFASTSPGRPDKADRHVMAWASSNPAIAGKKVTGLFVGPRRAGNPSVDGAANQTVDASHSNVVCLLLDRTQRQ